MTTATKLREPDTCARNWPTDELADGLVVIVCALIALGLAI